MVNGILTLSISINYLLHLIATYLTCVNHLDYCRKGYPIFVVQLTQLFYNILYKSRNKDKMKTLNKQTDIIRTNIISTLETSICGSKFSIKLVCKSRTPSWSLMDVPISKVPFSWLFFSIL